MFRLLILGLVLLSFNNAQAKVNIFACEAEWQSLAMEIGGVKVDTFAAVNAMQDAHHIRAKPSLIANIRKADLVICSGADLEVGWLPILLNSAGANLQVSKPGNLMAADYITTIEKPTKIDRALGDIHAMGNPHLHLNPYNILLVAHELKNRLQIIDAESSEYYQKQYHDFVNRWQAAIKQWEAKAASLKGLRVVVYHKSYSYLIDWLGLDEAAMLEVRPGISPTSKHLDNVLKTLRSAPAKYILLTPYDPRDASEWLLEKVDIVELELPFTVGGNAQSIDLFGLFDSIVSLLTQAGRAND